MRNVLKDILYLSAQRDMYRKLYFIGIIAYIIMLVFSVFFYKERAILNDSAFTLFSILKDGSFCIQHFRIGDVFTQILPVLGCKASVRLNDILVLYSLGYIIFYFSCYIIAGSVFKQYHLAICILLFHLLITSETFYYIPSPLIVGATFSLAFFAFVTRQQKNRLHPLPAIIVAAASVLLAFFHPLLMFVLIYCAIFFLWQKELGIDLKILLRIGIIFFGALIFKMLFLRAPYEKHALGGLRNFVTRFPDYFSLYSHKRFFHNCLTEYYWVPFFFIAITLYYAVKKEHKKLLLFLFSVIGYYFLVNISYPDRNTPTFYMENLYMPLAFFLALPLVFDLFPFLHTRKMAVPLYIIILLTGCTRIYATHQIFTSRLNWERRFLEEHQDQKLIYPTSKVPLDTLQMVWGTPYEFWLLSTVEQGKTASIIIDDHPGDRYWAKFVPKSFLVNWNVYPYKELNPRYFHFVDTTTPYEIIK
jgi:hypothetical protein